MFETKLLLSFIPLLLAMPAQGDDFCKADFIGKRLDFDLIQMNGSKIPQTFIIKNCMNNVYVANESMNAVELKIKAGPETSLPIEFKTVEKKDTFSAVVFGTWNTQTGQVSLSQCPQGESWDMGMQMCMPDTKADGTCKPEEYWDVGMKMCMPKAPTTQKPTDTCPPNEYWDVGMHMCMPKPTTGKTKVAFHYDQFFVYTDSTGLRGRDSFNSPNMWMLMVNRKTSDRNEVGLSWMGTTDLWSVGKKGTPQPLQVGDGFIDSQHPHSSPIMGLTFSDILSLGKNGQHKLTFFFAPRGEATAGPEAFMHRASADGNPEAPLSHHLQDVFHVTSTVAGVQLNLDGKTTFEASAFSGYGPNPLSTKLDMHRPDSFGFRVNRQLNKSVSVGGSYAKVLSTDLDGKTLTREHQQAFSAWMTTRHMIKGGTLSTSSIWGAVQSREKNVTLNSFLEEYVYQLGKNGFFGRMEVLQRTPDQLDIVLTDGATGAKWVKATTFGYERRVFSRDRFKMYVGGAETKDFLPKEFQPAYGRNPWTTKAFLRITWGK